MHPFPVTYPALMLHDMTPPLSPTPSVESTNSPATPIDAHIPTFVDDREGTSECRFAPFKNSSEVWEEPKDVGYDPPGVTVADPEIFISPSSSLLSGLDLLGGVTPPPLPEVTSIPIRSRSHQTSALHNESFLDFPSPPTFVSNRETSFWGSRQIGSLTVSPLSHPGLAAPCDSVPQSTYPPQSNALRRRWSALPPAEFHPDNRRRSSECVTAPGTDTFWTRAAVTHTDAPAVPCEPFLATSHPSPCGGPHGKPPPRRRQKRQEKSDPFESFIDMSVTGPALSTSRVHRLFSKISGGLKLRSKRH